MPMTLTVIYGPELGRSLRALEGTVLRVGSGAEADVTLRGDPQLGDTHFAVYWQGDACRVRALNPAQGLWLRQASVQDAELRDGDELAAGATVLRAAYVPVARAEAVDLAGPRDARSVALDTLRAQPGRLYAVLDAAIDPAVLTVLRASGHRYQSLYDGWAAVAYRHHAPYLVRLRKHGRLVEQILEQGQGRGWGIFVYSDEPFVEVRRSLRRLLRVTDEDGAKLLFRFYDPQVLTGFWAGADEDQREAIAGDFLAVWAEADAAGTLRRLS